MGLNKKYRGYRCFDYLEKNVDYRPFTLSKELDWAEPYSVPLSPAEEERVQSIVAENVVISLHDHMDVLTRDVNEIPDYFRQGRLVRSYEGLSRSCLDGVIENYGLSHVASHAGHQWEDILYDVGMRLCDIAHQDFVILARRVDDILRARKEGKIAIVMSIEGGMPIENDIDRIDLLYGFGLRAMGLVFSDSNALGSGLREKRDAGLTLFGAQCVERMNKLGMLIDTAHSSDQTTLDAVEVSSKPIICSHAGARALMDIKRLKPDHVIKAIAAKGGLIGIEAAPHTTLTKRHPHHDIESVMEHFEYVKDLVGIDHVAFGPDTMYGDHVGFHFVLSSKMSLSNAFVVPEDDVPYVKGMENPTECSWNIVRWLVKHRYCDADIAKVIGGNTLRVLREVWV